MSTPTFAKTHNLIAYLEKPTESEGFVQIIDFPNGSSIKYALTVNDEVRIQALVDGKMVNIKESLIRRILRLDDAEGTYCLTNTEIFEGLAKLGYEKPSDKLTFYKAFLSPQWKFVIHTILQCLSAKTTSWNEFSSTMASAIICLATNQKFNFSRYILLSLVKNIEAGIPFFMFSRFVQLIIKHQRGDMDHHKEIFDTPALTKKVFANMKRVESGVIEIKYTYQERIERLEGRVEWLEEENIVLNEVKSVPFIDDAAEPVMEKEKSSKHGRKIEDIDADVEINLEKA
nr:hypothetical protein [Tanacetum cinerariifolium]